MIARLTVLACVVAAAGGVTVVEIINERSELSMFKDLLSKAPEAKAKLDLAAAATVFAPTDSAFEVLPAGVWQYVMHDTAAAERLVGMHIIKDQILTDSKFDSNEAKQFVGLTSIKLTVSIDKTGNDTTMSIATKESGNIIRNSTIGELIASDGVLHVMTGVVNDPFELLPTKRLVENDEVPLVCRELFRKVGLLSSAGDGNAFTVFCPQDFAFSRGIGVTSPMRFDLWTADQRLSLAQFLASETYYTLGSLEADLNATGAETLTVATMAYGPLLVGEAAAFGDARMFGGFFGRNRSDLAVAPAGDQASAVRFSGEVVPGTDGIALVLNGLVGIPAALQLPVVDVRDEPLLPPLFAALLNRTGVFDSPVFEAGNVTIFAPSDEAFNRINVFTALDFERYSEIDRNLLAMNHVVDWVVTGWEVQARGSIKLTMINREKMVTVRAASSGSFDLQSGAVHATVLRNETVRNGIVFHVSNVLRPNSIESLPDIRVKEDGLTWFDVILVAILGLVVVGGGAVVLYRGSINMYYKSRKAELVEQEEKIAREALKDDELKHALGRNHNGFRALGENGPADGENGGDDGDEQSGGLVSVVASSNPVLPVKNYSSALASPTGGQDTFSVNSRDDTSSSKSLPFNDHSSLPRGQNGGGQFLGSNQTAGSHNGPFKVANASSGHGSHTSPLSPIPNLRAYRFPETGSPEQQELLTALSSPATPPTARKTGDGAGGGGRGRPRTFPGSPASSLGGNPGGENFRLESGRPYAGSNGRRQSRQVSNRIKVASPVSFGRGRLSSASYHPMPQGSVHYEMW
ncbi:hypothetical protein DIPPA_14343 [Diplonema papillatum]|nr:hypothetical protein DIPPA_14343 [Diplonema papillatum]